VTSTVEYLPSTCLSAAVNKEASVNRAEWNLRTVLYATEVFIIGFLNEKGAKAEHYSDCTQVYEEICALLGYYAASSGNPFRTFRGNVSVKKSNEAVLLWIF
jgi:hypothetical protein